MVPATFPVLMGVSVIGPDPEALIVSPSNGPVNVLVQLKVVPPIVDVGIKLSDSVLQICCESEAALFVITGVGLTVTVTVDVGPEQLLEVATNK